MKIEIWYDFVCPFCFLGETKFEMALNTLSFKENISLTFRSFQLNPSQSKVETQGKDIHQIIAEKYHISYDQAKANNDRIVASAKAVGLNYRFDLLKPSNTEKAHMLAHSVKDTQSQQDFIKRVYSAYFEEGADISDTGTLLKLMSDVGLDTSAFEKHLEDPGLLTRVKQDQEQARALGVNGVPFFLIDGKYAISGAQSVEHFIETLTTAYQSR